ncbi:MAG: hypothetical protein ACJA1P_002547, partial [Maribacter sp.]
EGIDACLKPIVLENTKTLGLPSLLLLQEKRIKAQTKSNKTGKFFM